MPINYKVNTNYYIGKAKKRKKLKMQEYNNTI